MTTNILTNIQNLALQWISKAPDMGVDEHVYIDLATQLLKLIAKHESEERIKQMYRNEPDYSRHNPW